MGSFLGSSMDDHKNLILAIVLSLLVMLGYQEFFVQPSEEARLEAELDQPTSEVPEAPQPADETPPALGLTPQASPQTMPESAEAAESEGARIAIATARLEGSISLRGGRIDDVVLADYYDKLGQDRQKIVLLKHKAQIDGYYAEFGWQTDSDSGVQVPTANTLWQSDATALRADSPVDLVWENGAGLRFVRSISVDENFLFTIIDRVENKSGQAVALAPYGLLVRKTRPETSGFFILHEGALGVLGGELQEVDYDELEEDGSFSYNSDGGWLGITDKYWLAALIPDPASRLKARFVHRHDGLASRYQADFIASELTSVSDGGSIEVTTRLFAGAKEVSVIDEYEDTYNIQLFDRTIDWGWFYLLTKPIFWMLVYFHGLVGNFGVAILLLTVVIKLLFFPLANKQYTAMSRMKKLQPKMQELKERFADDKPRLQQEMMALYKKEKVNPAAGCLPILLQIPVFFALYKTLFVTIEMRQQPFFGWVQDLSAPDDLTFITGFGLFPWDAPVFLLIGVWPILMGLTMWLQMRLNPQSPDPIQAKIFAFMPFFFTFLLASFPVGLVIYWTWNNILSIAQQWVIMRRMGVSVSNE
jgi:YidC/Oxa1 family membrane protein insertase